MTAREIVIKGNVLFVKRTVYCYFIHGIFILLSLFMLLFSLIEVYKSEYVGAVVAGILGLVFLPVFVFSLLSEHEFYFDKENGIYFRVGYEFSSLFVFKPLQGNLHEIKEFLLKTNNFDETNLQYVVAVLSDGSSFELLGFRKFQEALSAKNELEFFLKKYLA